MEFKYDPPRYSDTTGIRIEWERDVSLSAEVVSGDVIIQANRAGLLTFAKHLITLAQEAAPPGTHLHYDAGNELEEGSLALVIEKV
jgi:hypothetical protein